MNIEQLNAYINKEPLDPKAIPQIMALIENKPYFQIAHLLLLKAMHQFQPEKYTGQLKISASFIADKKKLYQYIHSESITKPSVVEINADDKIEKNNEIKNIEIIEKIDVEIEKTKSEKDALSIENIQIKIIEHDKVNSITKEKTETTENSIIAADLIKKPEIKKKIDLSEEDIEKMANQNSAIKHKKIVTDFFHTPVKEKTEIKSVQIEQELSKTDINTETPIKKEFPGKEQIKNILEEKKKNIIAKNDISKVEIEIPEIKKTEQEIKEFEIKSKEIPVEKDIVSTKTDLEKDLEKIEIKSEEITVEKEIVPKKEESPIEKKIIIHNQENQVETESTTENNNPIEREIIFRKKPVIIEKDIEIIEEKNKKETEKTSDSKKVEESSLSVSNVKENEIIKEKINISSKIADTTQNKKDDVNDGKDTMSNIFSKIRQIKKEMNLDTGKTSEPIDINLDKKTPKVEEKKGPGRVIKESFIGFEESEIKQDDLIGSVSIKKDNSEEEKQDNGIVEEIKTSALTAKDLFKQHLKNKETEHELTNTVIKTDETKSPISKIVEKINHPEAEIVEKEEVSIKSEEIESVKEVSENQPENLTPSKDRTESAADLLLKRIAEKKKKIQEEREREKLKEEEDNLAKENLISDEISEKKSESIQPEIELSSNSIQSGNIEKEKGPEIESDISKLPKEKKSQFLIDSFIEKVDSMERLGTKETRLVGDISEKSTEENDEIMTETLADLYIQQKNYKKAIEIYNKLILKFPEKKTYFAIQIKKTESLIK